MGYGRGIRSLDELLARTSEKHLLGESYSVFTDSEGDICISDVAEGEHEFREDCLDGSGC